MLEDYVPEGKALPFIVENGQVIWHQTNKNKNISFLSKNVVSLAEQKINQNNLTEPLVINNSNKNSSSLFTLSKY